MLKIIVDSTCGLTQKEAQTKGYGYLPISIIVGMEKYDAGVNITSSEVLNFLSEDKTITTSQPSTGLIEKIVGKEAKENEIVIIFTISSHLSGTFSNVETVCAKYDNAYVVDTKSGGPNILSLVKWTEEKIKDTDITSLLVELNEKIKLLNTMFVVDNLSQLKKSGRISKPIAAMANFIGILPILQLINGKIEKVGNTRNKAKGFKKVVSKFKKDINNFDSVFLLDAGNDKTDIMKLQEYIVEELGVEVIICPLTSSISVHVGKGTIGLSTGYFKK